MNINMSGKWELQKKVKNSQGLKAFGGHILTAYRHPLTGKRTYLKDLDDQPKAGYSIDKPIKILRPDENLEDKLALDWLIAHPEVAVLTAEGISPKILEKKQTNPTITLRNLDYEQIKNIDDTDLVDRVIGRLSYDSGPNAISLTRLRYVLSYFNLPYYEKRYIDNSETEKKVLKNKLKDFARKKDNHGSYNAIHIDSILNDIESIEINYMVKEMIRLNIIKLRNNLYVYESVPLGTNMDATIKFFRENNVVYTEAKEKLLPLLKDEGFKNIK